MSATATAERDGTAGRGTSGDKAATDEPGGWYVPCGCDSHGDHLGCDLGCANLGCCHPVGLSITAATEDEADALAGNVPPPEYVIAAAKDRMRDIRERVNGEVSRLAWLIATQERLLDDRDTS